MLPCRGFGYEGISHPIKAFAFGPIANAVIHFVAILILCARFIVAFAFVIRIRIAHEWDLSSMPL